MANVIPSVFDRLLDDCPYLSADGIPGIRRNPAVRVVADKSIELSGLIRIDGVDVTAGDRVLAVAQSLNFLNGVYLASSDDWVRATTRETNELVPGAYWDVNEGYEYGRTQWRFVNTQDIALDSTPVFIERFTPRSQYQTIKELKGVVARDLETMLNTHREALFNITDGYPEASRSLVTYGMPDFSSFDTRNPHDRNRVSNIIKELINDFEPRLKNVSVAVELRQPHENVQNLHFRLDALLEVHPAQEQVVFDAVLMLATKTYKIEGSD
ncbi:MAG: type VI secretion system baseplate subunit TssE [Nitrosomonas sp.]|nr:type VI secretion system baseplate subunit TssE [Nitrosomonas sp.]